MLVNELIRIDQTLLNTGRVDGTHRLAVRAFRGVRQMGEKVERTHGVSRTRQFQGLLRLLHSKGFTAEEYYRFRLFRFDDPREGGTLALGMNVRLRNHLNSFLKLKIDRLEDKRVFYREASERGIPVPETVADFDCGNANWWGAATLPHADLFAKEAAAASGKGAARWNFEGEKWTSDGVALSEAELIDHFRELSVQAPMILQRCYANHAETAAVGGSKGLCTIRAVTLRGVRDAAPRLFLAMLRIPGADSIVDNFKQGGLAAALDIETGTLHSAVRRSLEDSHLDFAVHPQTSAKIAGVRLRQWPEARELILRTHATFPEFPSVGWDLSLTTEGPMIIEGNFDWGAGLAQQATRRGLGLTDDYPRHYLDWLEAAKHGNS